MKSRIGAVRAALLAVALLLPAGAKAADNYPDHTIKFIVPFSAGGGMDRWVRVKSSAAFDHWGVGWQVQIVSGAGGINGWKYMLNQPADGHTIMQTSTSPALATLMSPNPPIDPLNDIKVCAWDSMFRSFLLAKPDAPYQSWEEFVAYAKENPGKVTVGGSLSMLLGPALIFDQAGIEVNYVTYPGGGAAAADFLGGHIEVATATGQNAVSLAPDRATVLLNTSDTPNTDGFDKLVGGDVPYAKDLGLKGLTFPRIVAVHPDTPDAICEEISKRTKATIEDKSVVQLMEKLGEEIYFVPMTEAQQRYRETVENMKKVVHLLQ